MKREYIADTEITVSGCVSFFDAFFWKNIDIPAALLYSKSVNAHFNEIMCTWQEGEKMEERIKALKQHIQQLNDMGVRTSYIYQYIADSLRTTENEPIQLRRSKAFANILKEIKLEILPHELIAGSMLGMCPVYERTMTEEEQERKSVQAMEDYRKKKAENKNFDGSIVFEEGHAKSFEDDFTSKKSRWSLMSRVHHDASIEFKDLQKQIALMEERYAGCEDLEPYEIGRELERTFKIPYAKEDKKLYNELPWFVGNHLSLNYGRALKKGLSQIRDEVISRGGSETDPDKSEYYEAARIAIDAVIQFIKRYADELDLHSQNTSVTEERSRELKKMADICRKISAEPAGSFYEAVQMTWMLHIIANIQGGSALSFGRIDQYLYPYFKKDTEEQKITFSEAKELMECLWLKVNEPKMRTVQSVTLGGITPDGKDAVNELTRICLQTAKEVGMPYPNVGLRVNCLNPDWIYEEALETIKAGCGQPMLLNDEIWITNMMKLGYSREQANDYYNMGCVEIMIPGKQPNWGVTEAIAFPVLMEEVMRKWGAGEIKLQSFEDFMEAYLQEMDIAIEADRQEALQKKANMEGRCYDPYSSLLIDGCLENGTDMLQGGSECPVHWSVYAYGIGTASDSLCAVKKFVFDDQKVTLGQMRAALEADFEGYEELRAMLDRMTPAYGNGIEEVDSIADMVLTHFSKAVFDLNHDSEKDKYVSTLFGYFFHIYHGEIAGATPNGRFKGEPFSDSMGPGQGKDIKGPTRLLNSVIRLNDDYITGGYALNYKLNPSFLKEEKGKQATVSLLKTYIENRGPQIQVYTTNLEDIKDARIHPEKHRDLIVRVGGYCEFFVNLDKVLQNEIIARTMYGEG